MRRAASTTGSYRLYARLGPDGVTYVSASRVVNGAEAAIGSPVAVPSVNYRTGFILRAQVTGANPTTIRVKAWAGSEPAAWNYTATDSAGPQGAGRAGLRAYTSTGTTNAPVTITVDNYAANETVTPPPPRLRLRRRHLRRLHRGRPTRSRGPCPADGARPTRAGPGRWRRWPATSR